MFSPGANFRPCRITFFGQFVYRVTRPVEARKSVNHPRYPVRGGIEEAVVVARAAAVSGLPPPLPPPTPLPFVLGIFRLVRDGGGNYLYLDILCP